MSPKEKKEFRHNKQVFNQENTAFITYYEKTQRKEITASAALKALDIDAKKWNELVEKYKKFNGLNS